MNDKSQLLRGTLEGCILKIINDKETYGYEIAENLKLYGFKDISEGTIYPLLIRLEKNNFLNSTKNLLLMVLKGNIIPFQKRV
ncbi:PadR family transcriptional regulator [Clostridium botulinum A1 str. CFSAN002368]|nr:PadR family transcriptional regulator [Clostridium botulinum A1 str. CFSAN002368]